MTPSHPGSSLRDEGLSISKSQIEEMCRTYWNFGLQHLSMVGVAWDDADVKSQQQVRARMNAAVKTGGLIPPLLRLREALTLMLRAWDSLPIGSYDSPAVNNWLNSDIWVEAVTAARSTLKSAEADKIEIQSSDGGVEGHARRSETPENIRGAAKSRRLETSDAKGTAGIKPGPSEALPPTQKQDQAGTAGGASAASVVEALELARDYFIPRAKYVRGDPKRKNHEHRILDRIEDALSASSPPAGTAGGEI